MPKGLVYDKSTGKVLYKFDTSTIPTLKYNENYKLRDDINDILVDAIYNPKTDKYTNPIPMPIPIPQKTIDQHRSEYKNLKTDSERIAKIAEYIGLK